MNLRLSVRQYLFTVAFTAVAISHAMFLTHYFGGR
jgi:hypothetical protein